MYVEASRILSVSSQSYIFTVQLPLKAVWSFMNDRVEVGNLFPGCKEVKILNNLDSLWTVEFSLGPFSRTLDMKGHTTELIENKSIAWTASHDLFVVSGQADFVGISEKETEVTYRLEARATGPVPFLQEIIIGQKMREIARAYIARIQERLALIAQKGK
jgi:carbon monoxide dehydrogenase subunit G